MNCRSCAARLEIVASPDDVRGAYYQAFTFLENVAQGDGAESHEGGSGCPVCATPLVPAQVAKWRLVQRTDG